MKHVVLIFLFVFYGCQNETPSKEDSRVALKDIDASALVVLGTAQDGGSPHIGCAKSCCANLWIHPDPRRKVVSLGIYDSHSDQVFILDASPDFSAQLSAMNQAVGRSDDRMPDGIFLTHAHIGHYTGLMYLGREAKGAKNVPVYVMPEMMDYLSHNGPWEQLVQLENIDLRPMQNRVSTRLSSTLTITPITVPHRDEYSETVGFVIRTDRKMVLYIPDIDKWHLWDDDILEWISRVDYAFLDATFYDNGEINNRDMSEIPHPFVVESISSFQTLSAEDKAKVHFIHLNHTNPVWETESNAYHKVIQAGHHVAQYGQIMDL